MSRVALYCRVSTDLQEKEHTIESQREALKSYTTSKDYQVVEEYLDDGHSGASLKRPGLEQLRDALSSRNFDLVLFHSPDRLAHRIEYCGWWPLTPLCAHGFPGSEGTTVQLRRQTLRLTPALRKQATRSSGHL